MRIAVCLSGQPRTWRHTHESLFRFFSAHEVEVFFHSWDEVEPDERAALVAAYRPLAYEFGVRPAFLEAKRRLAERFPISPPFPLFDMFHSAAASIALALNAGRPYDLICRSRFDLIHDGAWDGSAPPAGCVAVPTDNGQIEDACNDQFAIADSEAMSTYADILNWLPAGLEILEGPAFRPEAALAFYLSKVRGLAVRRDPIAVMLLRDGQAGLPFGRLRDDPMFHARKREDWEAFARAQDIAGALNFEHYGRRPLAFDRWVATLGEGRLREVLAQEWPLRFQAIERLVAENIGAENLDEDRYSLMRFVCAALIHRMSRDEPMEVESFVVHALSANALDMRRAQQWIQATPQRISDVITVLAATPALNAAFRFAPPFDQSPVMGWRVD